jgi:hypothetical protein
VRERLPDQLHAVEGCDETSNLMRDHGRHAGVVGRFRRCVVLQRVVQQCLRTRSLQKLVYDSKPETLLGPKLTTMSSTPSADAMGAALLSQEQKATQTSQTPNSVR